MTLLCDMLLHYCGYTGVYLEVCCVCSYQPAPFFVLDEIDAALDNTNIGKVGYITIPYDYLAIHIVVTMP